MPPWIAAAASCLCATLLVAQAQGTKTPPDAPGTSRTFRSSCSEATSRDLFTACDADGDDRLDIFEASDALETIRHRRDAEGFAKLDSDRDGYVTWPEFDTNLRTTLQQGGTFRVRTVRPFAPTAPEPKAATALQQFLKLHDSNQNGGLDTDEIDQYLRQTKLPPTLGGQLRKLDLDGNSRLEEAELAPWFETLPGRAMLGAALPTNSPLMPPWSAADRDANGTISVEELRAVLRRLDPALDGWATELLRALDRNRDGVLQPDEVPGAKAKGGATAATAPLLRQLH